MKTEGMIAVMQAYENGQEIELCKIGSGDWDDYPKNSEPVWNWGDWKYRVKSKKKYINVYESIGTSVKREAYLVEHPTEESALAGRTNPYGIVYPDYLGTIVQEE